MPATAWQTFDPLVGLAYTCRVVVDELLLGLFGGLQVTSSIPLVIAGWLLLAGLGTWWWCHSPHRLLLVLGLGTIFSSYLLIFSARAYFPYEAVQHSSRYHLLAMLGLAFILGGGPLVRLSRRTFVERHGGLLAVGLLTLLVASQLPQCHYLRQDPEQPAALRRIVEIDARCRAHRIDAATAGQALPPLPIAGCFGEEVDGRLLDGWYFLRGSSDPLPLSADEARRLLE